MFHACILIPPRKPPSRPYTRARGFTLIELLLVTILLAILYSTAAPRFSGSKKLLDLRHTAQMIQEQVRYARRLAITANQSILVVIDPYQRETRLELPENAVMTGAFQLNPRGTFKIDKNLVLPPSEMKIQVTATGLVDAFSLDIHDGTHLIRMETVDGAGTIRFEERQA